MVLKWAQFHKMNKKYYYVSPIYIHIQTTYEHKENKVIFETNTFHKVDHERLQQHAMKFTCSAMNHE